MTNRLGVNLLYLVPGVVGGTEEYAVRVLRAVAEFPARDSEILLFAQESFALAYPDLATAFATTVIHLPGSRPARVVAESTWLAREARRSGLSALHHFGGRVPLRGRTPSAVTVHDLQPIDRPESFSFVKRRFLRYSLPRSAHKARLVIAVSNWVRETIIDLLGVAAENVAVVSAPCPPADRAAAMAPERVAALPPPLRRVVEAGDPYFVYPAITYEHKNHRTLIDAFAHLKDDVPAARLMLTGRHGPLEEAIAGQIRARRLDDRVIRTGRLAREHLDTLIAYARALAFPSVYEGFGLPVVEALALGCPPIAANATALPEAAAGAGVLVEPHSVSDWARALRGALDWDESTRVRLVAPARAHLAALHPPVVAAQWLDLHGRFEGC